MSKIGVGVGEDFPVNDAPQKPDREGGCNPRARFGHPPKGDGRDHRGHYPFAGPPALIAILLIAALAGLAVIAMKPLLVMLGIFAIGVLYLAHRRHHFDFTPDAHHGRQPPPGAAQ